MKGLGLSAFLLVSFVAASCLAEPESAPPSVSADAAYVAARELFEASILCGFVVAERREVGNHWAFPARVGYAGALAPSPILVDKKTGITSWARLREIERERRGVYPEF